MSLNLPDDANDVIQLKPTKAVVGTAIGLVGTAVTAGLAFAAPGDPAFIALTITSAVLTNAGIALGVFFTTNKPVA